MSSSSWKRYPGLSEKSSFIFRNREILHQPTAYVLLSVSTHADHLDLELTLQQSTSLHLDLLDLAGQTVLPIEDREFPAGESPLSVDIRGLAAGVYLVRSGGKLPVKRVVVW